VVSNSLRFVSLRFKTNSRTLVLVCQPYDYFSSGSSLFLAAALQIVAVRTIASMEAITDSTNLVEPETRISLV
jgi:hypothetical protein